MHVDIDKSELDKVVKTNLAIHADAKDFLNKINLEELTSLKISDWRKQINDWKELHCFEKETKEFSTKNALNTINKVTEENLDKYIIVTDV
ncbi:MAG: hypothetical protein GXO49_05330 [Chlorobi bacterium]|nr:hypothetical protein [Chlorobiota bacterium]